MRYFDGAISLTFSFCVGLKLKKPCKEYNRAIYKKKTASHTSRGLYKKYHMYERGLHKMQIAALVGSLLIPYQCLIFVVLVTATREFCKLWLAFSSSEPTILLAGGRDRNFLCKQKASRDHSSSKLLPYRSRRLCDRYELFQCIIYTMRPFCVSCKWELVHSAKRH